MDFIYENWIWVLELIGTGFVFKSYIKNENYLFQRRVEAKFLEINHIYLQIFETMIRLSIIYKNSIFKKI